MPSFYVFVHSSIKRPEDLKGKTVGITTFGSSTDFSIRYLIKKLGMEPDRDVKILQMGGQPQIVAGMIAGAIQAGVFSSPANYNATKAGFQMLVDFKSVGLDYPTVSLVSTRTNIKSDPQTVRRFLMAYSEGTERLYRDKEFAMKVIGKYTKTADRGALEAGYTFATTFVEPRRACPTRPWKRSWLKSVRKIPRRKRTKRKTLSIRLSTTSWKRAGSSNPCRSKYKLMPQQHDIWIATRTLQLMKAIVLRQFGGPEALRLEECDRAAAGGPAKFSSKSVRYR